MKTQQQLTIEAQADANVELDVSVSGMTCASCVAHVEKAARTVPGVNDVSVNLARGRAMVMFDPGRATPETIAAAITHSGYPANPQLHEHANTEEHRVAEHAAHARSWFWRAMIGVALWLPVELLHWGLVLFSSNASHATHGGAERSAAPDHLWMHWLALATSTIAIAYVGWGFYVSAWKALRRRTTNMDTLIAMGASVAYVYSLVAFFGYLSGAWNQLPDLYFMEATGLLALISLGHWLEARARDSAGSAIRELLNLAPATALRLEGSGVGVHGSGNTTEPSAGSSTEPRTLNPEPFREVPVADLKVGDIVLVRPGDRVPIDGVVAEGKSSVDESMITGESLPVLRQPGDAVIGGTLNTDGRLIVRVTKIGSETALAQIVKLVDHAQSSKPPVQKLADRIAAVFVPAVLGVALLTAIGWFIVGKAYGWDDARLWGNLARAVCSVLIIACPCALGLAVPAALMVGTGRGAKRGILIRDIDALQNAERIETVVLDKTGTITLGKPVVVEVVPLDGIAPDELLGKAAAAELFSEHPVAKAIVAHARGRGVKIAEPASFANEPGLGVVAAVDGIEIVVGNLELLARHGAGDGASLPSPNLPAVAQTVVHVATKSPAGELRMIGTIALADEIKADSVAAVRELHDMGLRTVLLTGDNEMTAKAIAKQVGIDDVRANSRPEGKADVIRTLQREAKQDDAEATAATGTRGRGSGVAMVGDGINDAPTLAQADLGIAIGSGSDVAKEAGDIVLVGGSLHGVAAAVRLSRATMRTIRQNLFFAFIYNVIAIPLAALGLLNPLIAAAAMALSDVTVIGNALRLRRTRID
ncbi:MAG: heavy metal translocating P-type ATPase [Tepidisphaeraceae bacterium]